MTAGTRSEDDFQVVAASSFRKSVGDPVAVPHVAEADVSFQTMEAHPPLDQGDPQAPQFPEDRLAAGEKDGGVVVR